MHVIYSWAEPSVRISIKLLILTNLGVVLVIGWIVWVELARR